MAEQDPNPSPNFDPNTPRELAIARADLVTLRRELNDVRGERDHARQELLASTTRIKELETEAVAATAAVTERESNLTREHKAAIKAIVSCGGLMSAPEAGPGEDAGGRDAALGKLQDEATDLLDRPANKVRCDLDGVFFGVMAFARCRTAAITA